MVMRIQRGFLRNESALSAVLAVAMLIGVVVLLGVAVSAMIFILVNDQPDQAPVLGFTESEFDDQWLLTSAPPEIQWADYEMRVHGNQGTMKVRLNAEAGAAGLPIDAAPVALTGAQFPGTLAGGQFLDFCSSATEYTARISLVHTESQAIAHRFVFQLIPADPLCV
jgi:hypothetical protein